MGRDKINTRAATAARNAKSPAAFFNQSIKPSAVKSKVPSKSKATPIQTEPQPLSSKNSITLTTPIEFLLADILYELKFRNSIELQKIYDVRDGAQKDLAAEQARKAEDDARFGEIQSNLYL